MSEQSTDLKPSLFDGDDAAAGRVDRATWRIMGGRLEPADPVRCPKCGGPHPFHDPACVVHPDLIQDHENGRSER